MLYFVRLVRYLAEIYFSSYWILKDRYFTFESRNFQIIEYCEVKVTIGRKFTMLSNF